MKGDAIKTKKLPAHRRQHVLDHVCSNHLRLADLSVTVFVHAVPVHAESMSSIASRTRPSAPASFFAASSASWHQEDSKKA